MSSLNQVMLIGNLGKDAEIRKTQGGNAIMTFSVATTEKWTDKSSGELKERTEWHRIVVFNEKLTNAIKQYLNSGTKVFVQGQLQTRTYEDKEGVKKYSTEVVLTAFDGKIVLLGGREGKSDGERASAKRAPTTQRAPAKPTKEEQELLDDEIPF